MSDKRISELNMANSLTGEELFAVVQNGITKKITANAIGNVRVVNVALDTNTTPDDTAVVSVPNPAPQGPPLTNHTQNILFLVKFDKSNTKSVIFKPDTVITDFKPILKNNGNGVLVALVANDIPLGIIVPLIYDGTQYQLVASVGKGGEIIVTGQQITYDGQGRVSVVTTNTTTGNVVTVYSYKTDGSERLDYYEITKNGQTKRCTPVYDGTILTQINSLTII